MCGRSRFNDLFNGVNRLFNLLLSFFGLLFVTGGIYLTSKTQWHLNYFSIVVISAGGVVALLGVIYDTIGHKSYCFVTTYIWFLIILVLADATGAGLVLANEQVILADLNRYLNATGIQQSKVTSSQIEWLDYAFLALTSIQVIALLFAYCHRLHIVENYNNHQIKVLQDELVSNANNIGTLRSELRIEKIQVAMLKRKLAATDAGLSLEGLIDIEIGVDGANGANGVDEVYNADGDGVNGNTTGTNAATEQSYSTKESSLHGEQKDGNNDNNNGNNNDNSNENNNNSIYLKEGDTIRINHGEKKVMLLPSTPESWGMKLVAQETSFFVLAVVENSPAFHVDIRPGGKLLFFHNFTDNFFTDSFFTDNFFTLSTFFVFSHHNHYIILNLLQIDFLVWMDITLNKILI